MERKLFGHRPNRFRNLFYDGDWHSQLATALMLAKNSTTSQELVTSIQTLEQQLMKTDECIHTVTVVQTIPLGMEAAFLMNCIEQYIDVEPANLCLTSTGHIELMITARGNLSAVQSMAASILSYGVARANGIISAEKWTFK
ncbi:MAG: hypothetical protein HGA71_06755 [Azonexaceae bacterium]|nr:hypothetical protein [Azonexaceae bacterium]